jgi:hypothetical protein
MPLPVLDTAPVHPDSWYDTYWAKWPFGPSKLARTAMRTPARTFRGNSVARTTALPAGWTTDPDGAYRLPDNYLIFGNIDWQGVKVRGRKLILANTWFDAPGRLPLTDYIDMPPNSADRPPQHLLDGTKGIFQAPSCQLDIEEFTWLGPGAGVNEFGKAYQLVITGTPPAGATLTLDIRYQQVGGAIATKQVTFTAPFTGASLRTKLATLDGTFTTPLQENTADKPSSASVGVFFAGTGTNGPFTLDTTSALTLDDPNGIRINSKTGAGWTPDIGVVNSNVVNNKSLQAVGARSLARLGSDPAEASYPSGIHRWYAKWRLSDLIGWGSANQGCTFWHYSDYGLHPDILVAFGGGHKDTHQWTNGGNAAIKIAVHRFCAWVVANAGDFMMPGSGDVIDWAMVEDFLIFARGSGSKPFHFDLRGGAITNSGALNGYVGKFCRSPVTEQATTETPRYLETDAQEMVLDGYKIWPDGTEVNPPAGWSGTRRRRPGLTAAGYTSPTPVTPVGETGGGGGDPGGGIAAYWAHARARMTLNNTALAARQTPFYTNPATGGIPVAGTGVAGGPDGSWLVGDQTDWWAGFLPAIMRRLERYMALNPAASVASTAAAWSVAASQVVATEAGLTDKKYPWYTRPVSNPAVNGWAVGDYTTVNVDDWFPGFFVGIMALLHEKQTASPGSAPPPTGSTWLAQARSQAIRIRDLINSGNTASSWIDSNLGFLFWSSLGQLMRIDATNAATYRAEMGAAANTMATKYVAFTGAVGGVFRGTHGDTDTNPLAIIDITVASELLLWNAITNSGPASHLNRTVDYLRHLANNHFRKESDGGIAATGELAAYHQTRYNGSSGAVVTRIAGAGLDATINSCWARGQAWAMLGFTTAYRYLHGRAGTHTEHDGSTGPTYATLATLFLDTATKAADFWCNHLPSDGVPWWDFANDPAARTQRDSSAAAIASRALVELSSYMTDTGDPTRASRYRDQAVATFATLAGGTYLHGVAADNSVLSHARGPNSLPTEAEQDRGTIWGDYYFVDLMRTLDAVPPSVDTTWNTAARTRQDLIDAQASRTNTVGMHDLGFMFRAHLIEHQYTTDPTRRAALQTLILQAAETLARRTTDTPAGRWNATAGVFETLEPNAAQPGARVIIDFTVDLELLAYAYRLDPARAHLKDRAIAHATKVIASHQRTSGRFPGSFSHIVEFDRTTGAKVSEATGQGFDPSTLTPPQPDENAAWARGWSWGIYGFTMLFRYFGVQAFLDAAKVAADAWVTNVPANGVPFWDFYFTTGQRDTSAAAIAAAGMAELAALIRSRDPAAASRYDALIDTTIAALGGSFQSAGTNHPSILIHGVQNNRQADTIDKGLIVGDAYWVELLTRRPGGATPDTAAPSAVINARIVQRGPDQITIAWDPAIEEEYGSGLAAYRVQRRLASGGGSAFGARLFATSIQDTGLTPATSYVYDIWAVDNNGNVGPTTSITVATTGDVTNPTTPGTPTAPTVTAASVRIDWAASTDDVGVTGYRIWRGPGPAGAANSLIATVTGTTLTYTDTTVLPSTPYTYKVQAEDAAGNRSAKSTGVDVTTPTGTPPADTTPPSVPAHLAAVVVTG